MTEDKVFLTEFHIKNYRSLGDVRFSLKPLTVLVGPNASGKSNALKALELIHRMMRSEKLPDESDIKDWLFAGCTIDKNQIGFELVVELANQSVRYHLVLQPQKDNQVVLESLIINKTEVIVVENSKGHVQDENGENRQIFEPTTAKLALKSAVDFGHKPITKLFHQFIRNWAFYDIKPDEVRKGKVIAQITKNLPENARNRFLKMDDDGSALSYLLSSWHDQEPTRFAAVNNVLQTSTGLNITQKDSELCLDEGYNVPISLEKASDGTMRLLVYSALLNQPELPPLITIEEPERNLHPAMFTELARLLEQLAQKTQVIITTHSSQLLDTLNPKALGDTLGVLLLQNKRGQGTQVLDLAQIQQEDEAMQDWIADFGVGSAIFQSQLLQEVMEV